jgi:Bacterial transcription activator, effector binding domain.
MQDVLQVRTVKLDEVKLIGFTGDNLDDQHRLFVLMDEKIEQINTRISDNHFLVILPELITLVAVEVKETINVPNGMTAFLIPEDDYVIFKFEEKYVSDFWESICTIENQTKYNIDLSKPRYEIFKPDLQSNGFTEWYIPIKH